MHRVARCIAQNLFQKALPSRHLDDGHIIPPFSALSIAEMTELQGFFRVYVVNKNGNPGDLNQVTDSAG